jgi:hypothetical protein
MKNGKIIYTLLALITASAIASASDNKGMYLTIDVLAVPQPEFWKNGYLAGSPGHMVICVRQSYEATNTVEHSPLHCVWPEGLTINVKTADGVDHSEWLSDMKIAPRFSPETIIDDALLLNTEWSIPQNILYERYDLNFIVPPAAAGQTITVFASYDHPQYGHLETKRSDTLKVIALRSAYDLHYIWGAIVAFTSRDGSNEHALALTDSFVAQGYSGIIGLATARKAAIVLKRYDKALQYLDLCMAANGQIEIPRMSDVAWENHIGAITEEERQRNVQVFWPQYVELRADYLQQISEQQQH